MTSGNRQSDYIFCLICGVYTCFPTHITSVYAQKPANKTRMATRRESGPILFVSTGAEVAGLPPSQPGVDNDDIVGPEANNEDVGPPRPPMDTDNDDMVGPPRPSGGGTGETSSEEDDDDDESEDDEDEYRFPLSNEIMLKGHTKACHSCFLESRGWFTVVEMLIPVFFMFLDILMLVDMLLHIPIDCLLLRES